MTSPVKSACVLGIGSAAASLILAAGVAVWLGPVPAAAWVILAGGSATIGSLAASAAFHAALRVQTDLKRLSDYVETTVNSSDAVPPGNLSGAVQRFAGVVTETTARLRGEHDASVARCRELELEARVNETQRRNLEAILNAISDGVIVTDAFNEIVLANGAAAQALRFDLGPSLRRPIDEVLDDARLVKLIKDARDATAADRRSVEHRARDERVFRVTSAVVGHERHAPGAGVVTVLRDVTHDKEVAAMKSEFVSQVSHELRTPLSSIKAYVEMLIDGEAHDEPTRGQFYDIVQSETDRLERMIDNILSISKIDAGVTSVNLQRVDLVALLRSCIGVLRPQAESHGVTVHDELGDADAHVFIDREMVHQAAINLLSNALKYTPRGGEVHVTLEADPHENVVSFAFRDTGPGIPADELPRLFQKFYRAPSNNRLAGGTGLGLNLVKQVVETVHGGRVVVKSEIGVGSTFTCELPMAETNRGLPLVGGSSA